MFFAAVPCGLRLMVAVVLWRNTKRAQASVTA
jgi:hypothetical protein